MKSFPTWLRQRANQFLAVAVVTCLLQTALRAVPAPEPWMVWWGELLYDASLAYFVGWVFNWLAVERPRQRERKLLRQSIEHRIDLCGSRTTHMLDWMWRCAHGRTQYSFAKQSFVEDAPAAYSEEMIREILKRLEPRGSVGLMRLSADGTPGKQTWLEYLTETVENSQQDAARLLPYVNHLAPEILNASSKFDQISLIPLRMFDRMGGPEHKKLEPLTLYVHDLHQVATDFAAVANS